jgi:hypothetical protein
MGGDAGGTYPILLVDSLVYFVNLIQKSGTLIDYLKKYKLLRNFDLRNLNFDIF